MVRTVARSILVDGNGHLLGRIAAAVAKELLQGQRITVVRCEGLNMSGPFARNKLKFLQFLRKRTLTNPKRGPFHHRAPSEIFMRVVRGMLPSKTKRGKACLRRLKAFEGIPPVYAKRKRQVCPRALRDLKLAPDREYCTLGRLAHETGWKYQAVVEKLEKKRKERSAIRGQKKQALAKIAMKVKKEIDGKLPQLIGEKNAALLSKFGVLTA
eukprot:NODE_1523_length_840_cov_539.041719_g1266_i0.p2 GENE.NODE_1523_length_840_cov_539.041719_g1266_i0~~NODE_1523_length_840_cov_539.041719_g1266_i0.p2  ORF type:complete len:212 (+),score=66.67 NODE_1523_length_840_cov_539.041719_g1266_i0:54-689(+)